MKPSSKSSSTKQPAQRLPVKELAAALGVSFRFIYQMRACGFPMSGDIRYRQVATVKNARAWIKANNFRLVNSIGVIDGRESSWSSSSSSFSFSF